ncbi:2-hydroxyacid dehydrogenase [Thermosipho atlanticus]|uniref:Lactate dehydrogenase n=1 Tax=Thermosipho atlanticus DSM 15807 TaxID=1123380 RepID=A0A1M5S3M8_9BACT|nr:2-hydroxyacid dehydrogenase [Thermosipho atlanticus]SHH33055.1 Lactate dehydrogenase [Thermosipho atlanticus DSM 15807]
MKILVLTKITSYFEKLIKLYSKKYDLEWYTNENLDGILPEVEAVIGASLTEEQIKKAKNLKIIFVPWTGTDKLPWRIIREKNIIVSNSHGNGKIVAERALALALTLLGRVVEYHNDLIKGIWHGFVKGFREEDYWISLQNKSVSILGTGVIGRQLAKLLKGFDCKIIGFKRHIEKLEGFDYITNSIEDAILAAHIIFLTLPLTKETFHIINKDILNKMEGKFLINVGRGELIDEEALYNALSNGKLLGFASDVWYEYPDKNRRVVLPFHYPFHTFKNVVISPHVGGFTLEGQIGRIDELFENILSYLKTGKPKNIVDPEKMY